MEKSEELSRRLKMHLRKGAVGFMAMWFFVFPTLLYSHSWGFWLMLGIMYGYSRYEEREEKKLKDEIDRDRFAYHRYRYRSMIWVYWAIIVPHLALAALLSSIFVWVLTGLLVVIGAACLLHTWIETKELAHKEPNHLPHPRPATI